jgi:sortase A
MRKQQPVVWAERFFLLVACLTLGYCLLVYSESGLYQAFETRRFENALPLSPTSHGGALRVEPTPSHVALQGSPISRMEIPSIGVSVMVVEGVKPRSLRLAVGHIPGTAFPGEPGNVGIAGHRDTFFRRLRDIRAQDVITLRMPNGSYQYSVESTQIVDPTDVQVLEGSGEPILTLVTCYPFYFVGPAPLRYVVRARRLESLNPEQSPVIDRFTTFSSRMEAPFPSR